MPDLRDCAESMRAERKVQDRLAEEMFTVTPRWQLWCRLNAPGIAVVLAIVFGAVTCAWRYGLLP